MRRLVFAAVFAVIGACCKSPGNVGVTPAPSSVPGPVSAACDAAVVHLPDECRTVLRTACSSIEASGWLAPDYLCLRTARSCVDARACPTLDVRPVTVTQ